MTLSCKPHEAGKAGASSGRLTGAVGFGSVGYVPAVPVTMPA